MLMGTILKGTRYSTWEYAEAVLVTIGVTVFSLSKGSWAEDAATWQQAMGFSLLCIYVLSDSFTAQWQSKSGYFYWICLPSNSLHMCV